MAKLLRCICGKAVSSNAYACPQCGHKIRSTPINIVGKIVLLIIVLIIAIPIGSCLLFSVFMYDIDRQKREINNSATVDVTPDRNGNIKIGNKNNSQN